MNSFHTPQLFRLIRYCLSATTPITEVLETAHQSSHPALDAGYPQYSDKIIRAI